MHDDTDFTGKAVLVVGGSSGIGNGIAQAFRRRGADVHVWGTRKTAAEYDGVSGSDLSGVGYSCVNVGDPDAIASAPEPFAEGRMDVLILCQGTVEYQRREFEQEGWDRVMAVNLDSLMHCSRRFRPALEASAGSITIVSSLSGYRANKGNPAYAASKAGAINTTVSEDGTRNAAPYSFFNAVGDEPPMVVLGLLKDPATGGMKNTASNIAATGEFVVNLVCEADAEKMNMTSIDAPADLDELEYANIETLPSTAVTPERIASSPVSFECRSLEMLEIGPRQTIVIGEILVTHIKDEFILDPDKVYLDTPAMKLIGRVHGSGWYARGTDLFKMDRPKPLPKD